MAYKKQTWVDDETVGTADRFNHMEAGIEEAGKTGGVSTGAVIGWTGEEIPEGYEEVDSSLIPSGVEVGTIVHIENDALVPEGYVEVTDEDEITLVEPSELFTISEGFTLLFDSNIYKHRNRYFGDITIQKDEGNFDEWGNTVATFKKTMIGMCNTGCFLCAGQWNTNVVGHCFIGATEISVANKTGVNNYNVAKIKFDVVSNETNATKPIEKKSVTPIEPKTGHIYDTTNIDNKAENTYSANTIDGLVNDSVKIEDITNTGITFLNGFSKGTGCRLYKQGKRIFGQLVITKSENWSTTNGDIQIGTMTYKPPYGLYTNSQISDAFWAIGTNGYLAIESSGKILVKVSDVSKKVVKASIEYVIN